MRRPALMRPRAARLALLLLASAVSLGTLAAAVLLGWIAALLCYALGTLALLVALLVRRSAGGRDPDASMPRRPRARP